MLKAVINQGHAWGSQVLFGNLGKAVVHLDFGGEAPGVTKFYKEASKTDEASVVRHFEHVLLMVGTGGYNGRFKRDKGIVQRHGSKKAK